MNRFLDKVFNGDSLGLLRVMPTASVDAVIADAMYGTAKNFAYDWGPEPARGDPALHWLYHSPIYEECLRVLKPGGVLAWGQGSRFLGHHGGLVRPAPGLAARPLGTPRHHCGAAHLGRADQGAAARRVAPPGLGSHR